MKNLRATLILSLFVVGLFMAPTGIARAQTPEIDLESPEQAAAFQQYAGQIFGMFQGFGASGELLGQVLQMMLADFNTFNDTQAVADLGVYLLNASKSVRTENLTHQYGNEQSRKFRPWGVYNLAEANSTYEKEAPYFVLEESGYVKYNKTEGVSTTFIIWDSDGSLIDALDRLVTAIKRLTQISNSTDSDEQKIKDAVNEVVSAVTYFLIHINDIINGDEVIILNIIAYTEYEIDFGSGSFAGTWYVTQNKEMTNEVLLENVLPTYKEDYLEIANSLNDSTMQYLLTTDFNATKAPKSYTDFSFDIVQIWLKNFHVEIDVEPLLEAAAGVNTAVQGEQEYQGPEFTLTSVFHGMDIEFYIFTHHFQNVYLYDDSKFSVYPEDSALRLKAGNNMPDVLYNESSNVQNIYDSEVTHYLQFKEASWSFKEPVITDDGVSWGIRGDDIDLRVIPVGISADDANETESPLESIEYYELGFTFEPIKQQPLQTQDYINGQTGEVTLGHAKVKFDQAFGEWNNGTGPITPALKAKDLDLTTLFMSTILHVHINFKNAEETTTTTTVDASENATATGMANQTKYDEVTKKIYVGDFTDDLPLASIDIASQSYEETVGGVKQNRTATSNIIPTMYADVDAFSSGTYEQADNSTGRLNTTLNVQFSVLLYAVAYPDFNSNGNEIVHDPTFSIYIEFENPGVWAVLLVIGVVSLVGIAAMMITKKKNAALGI